MRIDSLDRVVLDEKELLRAIPRVISPRAMSGGRSPVCGLIEEESLSGCAKLDKIMVSNPVNPAVALNEFPLIKLREMAMIKANRRVRGSSVAAQSERA